MLISVKNILYKSILKYFSVAFKSGILAWFLLQITETQYMKFTFSLIIFNLISFISLAQQNPLLAKDVEAQHKWVDSVYNSMTLEEKVGQLFMVQAFSNKDLAHEKQHLWLN